MRDRVRLATDVWLPQGSGPFPAILLRSPYDYLIVGAYQPIAERLLAAGYAFVMQFVRGQWGSEGRFTFLRSERADGHDAVEWVAAQSWCDGNLGMMGASYLAMTQLSAAAIRPPHLKAISPVAPVIDFFEGSPYQGGAFCRNHQLTWTRSVQQDFPSYMQRLAAHDPELERELQRRLRSRPLYDAADGWLEGPYLEMYDEFLDHPLNDHGFWDQVNYTDDAFRRMDVPSFWISGHFDVSTRHCIAGWQKLNRLAPPNPHHMLLGPYTHGVAEEVGQTKLAYGPYEFADNVVTDNVGLRVAFFDRHVRGREVAADLPDRVRVYITGSNVWRDFSDMPVPQAADQPVYLSSYGGAQTSAGDGAASFAAARAAASDTVLADPENPVQIGDPLGLDVSSLLCREDVLVYTSEPLPQPLTVVGQPEAVLYVATSTPDADVIVGFGEVRPDGRTIRLASGVLRLRYRQGFDREVLMVAGETAEVRMVLDWVGHTLLPGSRLRVTIRGTDFPNIDPNPNTGEPVNTAVRLERTRITVVHTPERPSHLRLPTIAL